MSETTAVESIDACFQISNLVLSADQRAPASGTYDELNTQHRPTGLQITLERGEPLPRTSRKHSWRLSERPDRQWKPSLPPSHIPVVAQAAGCADLFATALNDRGDAGDLMVEREGGGLHPTSLRWWLRAPAVADPIDFVALDLVRSGPVLDIGCATGRHVEALQRVGVAAEGIDINHAAIAIAREHGCNVRHADFWTFDAPHRYQWLIVLGNNLGIAERISDLPRFLDRLADLLVMGGQVLLSSVESRPSNAARGRSSGEVRLRHHYGGRRGDWFQWLYVTPEVLGHFASRSGFTCSVVHRFGEVYVAVLTLTSARPAPAE